MGHGLHPSTDSRLVELANEPEGHSRGNTLPNGHCGRLRSGVNFEHAGGGIVVFPGHRWPAGLFTSRRMASNRQSSAMAMHAMQQEDRAHHGLEQPGLDCSAGELPPTIPAAHP
eukprot:466938-Prymnesium_polylepis.1